MKQRPSPYFTAFLWCALLTLLGSSALAQTRTWDGGGGDNNWSTANNWSSTNVPDTTNEAALFTDDPGGENKLTPNLSASVTNGQIQFSATARSYEIASTGGSILYLSPASFGGSGITVASGAANQTISAEVWLLSNQSWDIEGTTTLTVSGTIEDPPDPIAYGITKIGTGTLVLSGDARYDGGTTVNGGLLVMSYNILSMEKGFTVIAGTLRATTSANALGNVAANTVTLAGGALELANDTSLTFGLPNRNTTVSSNATIRSDRLTAGAGVTHSMGALGIGAQTLSVAAGTNVNSGTAGLTFGTTTLSASGGVFDVAGGANLTLAALNGNFSFTKQNSGQLTLNTSSTRSGGTVTLSGGTMRLGVTNALGTAAVPLSLNGGTLDLATNRSVNAYNTTVGGNATIASDRSTTGAGITNTLGTLGIGTQTLSVTAGANVTNGIAGTTFGATTLSGNATFDVVNSGSASAQLTLGAVGQAGGVRSLSKTGNGTLTLSGVETYTGDTTISGGTLALSGSGSIPDSTNIIIGSGATLDVSGFGGDYTLATGQSLQATDGATATINGSLNLGSAPVLMTNVVNTPTIVVTGGNLTLGGGEAFTVNLNNGGTPLGAGSYKLIASGAGGSVVGTAPAAVMVGGDGLVGGDAASLSISNQELYLVVSGGTLYPPTVNGFSMVGGEAVLSFSGTNGQTWRILTSTNLAMPIASWDAAITGTFAGLVVNYTNASPVDLQRFYIITSP